MASGKAGTTATSGVRKISRYAAVTALTLASSLGVAQSASAVPTDDNTPSCRAIPVASPTALPRVSGELSRVAIADHLIPVWALVEDDLPITGGNVRLYSGAGESRREIAVAGRSPRTNSKGSVVLRPKRVPKDLTVVVRGGKVGGKPFPGSLEVSLPGYRAPDVVTVNPVTTIVAEYARVHPEKSLGKVRSRVKRYLEIPRFHDIVIDLRRSDRYFDGDVLLQRLKGRRMSELVTSTVRSMDNAGRRGGVPFVGPQRFLGEGLEEIGAGFIAKNLLSGVLSGIGGQAANAVIGQVLSVLGIGGDSTATELAAIQSQLTAISAQLSDLEAGVSHLEAQLSADEYKTLVSGADADQSLIDGAENCLSYILSMSPSDPSVKTFSKALSAYIGQNLLTVEDDMTRRLSGENGLIKASYESQLALTTDQTNPSYPFWTQGDGDAPRAALDYYAGYQAMLGMFMSEYDHVNGEDDKAIAANVQSYVDDINREQAQLKPRVPNDSVVDTGTGLVWSQLDGYPCNAPAFPGTSVWQRRQNDGSMILKELPCGSAVTKDVVKFFDKSAPQDGQNYQGETVQADGYSPPYPLRYGTFGEYTEAPFTLRTASEPEVANLIKPWNGPGRSASPKAFLQTHGGFDLGQDVYWLDDPATGPVCFQGQNVCAAFNLATGKPYLASPDASHGILFVADAPAGTFW